MNFADCGAVEDPFERTQVILVPIGMGEHHLHAGYVEQRRRVEVDLAGATARREHAGGRAQQVGVAEHHTLGGNPVVPPV
jgi:hypothetical protein